MTNWRSIESAPKDGRVLRLGWLPNGKLEYEVESYWLDGDWEGGWTPTHWKPVVGRPFYPRGKAA